MHDSNRRRSASIASAPQHQSGGLGTSANGLTKARFWW